MAHASAAAQAFSEPETGAFNQRPVDLVHLARHTLGNRDLEREVLQIFVRQSAIYLDRIRDATTVTERQMAAHTIKGSARGIGAWKVADIAETLENPGPANDLVGELAEAVKKTNGFISGLLDNDT